MRQVGGVLVGNGAVVMAGNGGRQEGSLLKTPFYVDLHDTNTQILATQEHIQSARIIIELGTSIRGLLITLVPPVGFVIKHKNF